jgi:hypothetical protein
VIVENTEFAPALPFTYGVPVAPALPPAPTVTVYDDPAVTENAVPVR